MSTLDVLEKKVNLVLNEIIPEDGIYAVCDDTPSPILNLTALEGGAITQWVNEASKLHEMDLARFGWQTFSTDTHVLVQNGSRGVIVHKSQSKK